MIKNFYYLKKNPDMKEKLIITNLDSKKINVGKWYREGWIQIKGMNPKYHNLQISIYIMNF